jgi:hypothetical protein
MSIRLTKSQLEEASECSTVGCNECSLLLARKESLCQDRLAREALTLMDERDKARTALAARAGLIDALEGIVDDDSRFVSLKTQRDQWAKRMEVARAALAAIEEAGK